MQITFVSTITLTLFRLGGTLPQFRLAFFVAVTSEKIFFCKIELCGKIDIFLTPVMTAGLGFTHPSILEIFFFRSNRNEKNYEGKQISDRHDTMMRNPPPPPPWSFNIFK